MKTRIIILVNSMMGLLVVVMAVAYTETGKPTFLKAAFGVMVIWCLSNFLHQPFKDLE